MSQNCIEKMHVLLTIDIHLKQIKNNFGEEAVVENDRSIILKSIAHISLHFSLKMQ